MQPTAAGKQVVVRNRCLPTGEQSAVFLEVALPTCGTRADGGCRGLKRSRWLGIVILTLATVDLRGWLLQGGWMQWMELGAQLQVFLYSQ